MAPIFFWREFEDPHGFLSQWYALPFTAPIAPSPTSTSTSTSPKTLTFQAAEQYMMYRKALHFQDYPTASAILREADPRKQKGLGRKVKNFDAKVWDEVKEKVVEEGNWWKFTKGEEGGLVLGRLLRETGDSELVEASPFDRVWGVGFDAEIAEERRDEWGLNLLGKALMRVRERLREGKEKEKEKVERE